MKKSGLTFGRICVICLLSVFATSKSIADSDIDDSYIVPIGKHAQTPSESKKMKLAELVQRLEAANPWSIEKVSEALGGVDLTLARSNQYILVYSANNLLYEDGLHVKEAYLRLWVNTKQMIRLILYLSKNTKCITFDNLKKMYPDRHKSPYGDSEDGVFYYYTKRSWGGILFGFEDERPDCLGNIVFIPKGEK